MPKKVLFVINTLGTGGAETALVELFKRIEERGLHNGCKFYLYVLLNQGELIDQIPSYVEVLNTKFDPTQVHSSKGLRLIRKKAIGRLFSKGCAVRLSGYMISNFLDMKKKGTYRNDKLLWQAVAMGAEKFNEKYDLAVSFLEGGAAYYVSNYVNAKKKACFIHIDYISAGYSRKLDKDCYLKFDRIFPVSEGVKNIFLTRYPELKDKTEVFENLIDIKKIEENALERTGFSDDYAGFRIVSIGRLDPQKSFEVSVDAMKILKDKGFDVRWYVFGDGAERKHLEQRIEMLGLSGSFFLPGSVKNPYPYLKQCDVYAHASRYEGKSIAVSEARVLACPIVVTNCGGNREQVENGVDGLLCEFDAGDLASKIEILLKDRERAVSMGRKASIGIKQQQHILEENVDKIAKMIG